jgi:hypothetical protein
MRRAILAVHRAGIDIASARAQIKGADRTGVKKRQTL